MADSERLLKSAKSFCEAFGRGEELPILLSYFCNDSHIIEHGLPLPQLPYLGKKFEGLQEDDDNDESRTLADYFKLVGKYLNIVNEPVWGGWTIDCDCGGENDNPLGAIASCKGDATFLNRRTGKKWDETVLYRLELDVGGRIKVLEIWADSLSAFLATQK